jgi:ribonuclease R
LSEICARLQVRGGDRKKIKQYLLELVRREEAVKLRNHRFAPALVPQTVSGRLQYNRRGFGFVIPDDGTEDLFVPGDSLSGALHGDRVTVEVAEKARGRGRQEGRVRDVLQRGIRMLVGQIRLREDRSAFLIPFGQEIPYPVAVATPLPPISIRTTTRSWRSRSTGSALSPPCCAEPSKRCWVPSTTPPSTPGR